MEARRLRVCVTGWRYWTDWRFVWRSLNEFEIEHGEIVELGHGAATGVDSFAKAWCKAAGVPDRPYVADWDRYGDPAGQIRNIEMLEDFRPDCLLVFPGHVGTGHCTRHARKLGIERVFYLPPKDLLTEMTEWG